MASRKAPDNGDEKPAAKRQRRVDDRDVEVSSQANFASFDDLNEDVMVKILSYLQAEDMNSVACLNSHCREARSHESLDQTRTGIITFAHNDTPRRIVVEARGWNNVFSGNRTSLKIVGFENMASHGLQGAFSHVTSLDISCEEPQDEQHDWQLLIALGGLCPHIKTLDMSNVNMPENGDSVCGIFRRLNKITRQGSGIQHMGGYDIHNGGMNGASAHLTELNLDGSTFHTHFDSHESGEEVHGIMEERYRRYGLLMACKHLERVSIKNVTWRWDGGSGPVTQGMLIKIVRIHPTLRWLRSDLTEENVAMLKQEWPEITFVSE